jgi:hypothetical protein
MLPPKGLAFTENKKFAALAERKDAKDVIGIYYAGNEWKMINQIEVDTFDLQEIKWINGDSAIMVYDTALECKILIYSAATTDLLVRYEPDAIGLGIKKLCVSTNDNIISAGLFDGTVVLYNNLTAQEIC